MSIQKEHNISAEVLSVKKFFSLGQFIIPHYQRAYSWSDIRIKPLIMDMHESYKREPEGAYLLGSVTTIKKHNSDQYEILDGQQRLTTLSLMFNIVFSHIKDEEFELKTNCQNVTFLNEKDPRISQGRIADKIIYRYLLLGEGQKKDHKLIIADKILSSYEELLKDIEFIKFILNKTMFVWVNTHDLESAYQIFETLNDRSQALQKIDLVRNRLFHDMQPNQVETACGLWDDIYGKVGQIVNGKTADTHLQSIFTTYMEATQGMWIETKDLFSQVKQSLEDNKENTNYPYNLFTKIAMSFDLYMDLYKPGDAVGRISSILDTDLIRAIKEIKDLKISHALLFSLFDLLSKNNMTNKDEATLRKIILNLVHFIRRTRILGNLPAAKYGKEFNAMAKTIINMDSIDQLNEEWFLGEIVSIDKDNKSIVNDQNFVTKLINSDIKNEVAKDILIDIHNNQRDTSGELLTKTKDLHAEHICPQELTPFWEDNFTVQDHQYYLNKLGNYALLSEVKNKEASNKSFDDKKTIYSLSRFQITKELGKEPSWNKDTIIQRTEKLAQEIVKILTIE